MDGSCYPPSLQFDLHVDATARDITGPSQDLIINNETGPVYDRVRT